MIIFSVLRHSRRLSVDKTPECDGQTDGQICPTAVCIAVKSVEVKVKSTLPKMSFSTLMKYCTFVAK